MGSRLAEPYGGCRSRDPGARLHPPPIDHVEEVRTCATKSSTRSCCGRREPPSTPKPVNGQHRSPAATAESCICCSGRRDASGHRTGRASRTRRPGSGQRHLHPRGRRVRRGRQWSGCWHEDTTLSPLHRPAGHQRAAGRAEQDPHAPGCGGRRQRDRGADAAETLLRAVGPPSGGDLTPDTPIRPPYHPAAALSASACPLRRHGRLSFDPGTWMLLERSELAAR
jgi:hypothetical protein